MLLLREKTATIKNITFFADDSDDSQFWYLPNDIKIAMKNGKPIFSLIKYTGNQDGQQGGYINFEVNTALDESDLSSAFNTYLSQLEIKPKNPRKSPVPFNKGTVDFFVLDAEKNGTIVSAQSPSLIGDNSAIFSAKLTPVQSSLLEKSFNEAQAPAAVAYNLEYTGITPALKIKVTANFKNVYNEFDTKFGINIPIPVTPPATFWLGFDSVIKKLQQTQDLVIEVTENLPDEEAKKQKDWALQYVKEEILKSFFTATISPNEEKNEQAKSASESILDTLIEAGKEAEGLMPSASLELKLVHITETKSLNFNYKYSRAITQSAVPQNFIGSDLLHVAPKPPYFLEVDVNDPFYQRFDFTILGPDTFKEVGLRASSFNLEYDKKYYTADAFIAPDGSTKQPLVRSKNKDALFNIASEYTFKSSISSGWEGETSYKNDVTIGATTYVLEPSNFLSFKTINMMLDRNFTWDNYNQVVIELEYEYQEQGKDQPIQLSKSFTFNAENVKTQQFKYRCLTEQPWKINYNVIYYKVGGEKVTKKGDANPASIVISELEKVLESA
ncbi:hypothetical protein AADZ91_02895 [Colwelliaceae bacterium 6441]